MSDLTSFDEFIGNKKAIEKLMLVTHGGKEDAHARIPDLAFFGPSGHGKTTLAHILAHHLERKLLVINSTIVKDPFHFRGVIVDLYTNNPKGSIVLLDECHALPRKIQDNLLTATEHPRCLQTSHKDQTFSDSLPENFSFIFATTHSGKLKQALLTRLEAIELMPYTIQEQMKMALNYLQKKHNIPKDDISPDVLVEIAKRSRHGRNVVYFCDNIIKYMQKEKVARLTKDTVEQCFDVLDIDKYGLKRIDRIMLQHLLKQNTFTGLDTLEAIMPATKQQIKDQIEPFLMQRGFIVRTSSGRMITPKGRQAIKEEG